jgi:hypothetical protein
LKTAYRRARGGSFAQAAGDEEDIFHVFTLGC